jgi:NAD(P)H-dependent FMN reductase/kynurenine formamidase
MKIIAFAGSNSRNSINAKLTKGLLSYFQKAEVNYIDLKDVNVPIYSQDLETDKGIPQEIQTLYRQFEDADGFIVASPEYNGLMPGFFKNIIDWLSRIDQRIFKNKPVLLISTSYGNKGGSSNLTVLEKVMPFWGAKSVHTYSLGNFDENFSSNFNNLTDPDEFKKLQVVISNFKVELFNERSIDRKSPVNTIKKIAFLLIGLFVLNIQTFAQSTEQVGKSPWGPEDEIGTLNMMTDQSRLDILGQIYSGKVFDLSVEYFVGMPSFSALGDPGYQYWLTHTPNGTIVDNPNGLGEEMNRKVSYTGDAISMYTHMGTHIDALNHFGLDGKIWNGFTPEQHLGDKGWKKTGAESIPNIIARGVLIDVRSHLGELPPNYRITASDLQRVLIDQNVSLEPGDVVLIRTGQAKNYQDAQAYLDQYPGISLDAAKWLVEERKAMLLGADNLSFEAFPPERDDNWVPVHTYLLAEKGVMFIEQMYLEELAQEEVYTFAFIAGSLKLRGASGSPMRPIAIPIR